MDDAAVDLGRAVATVVGLFVGGPRTMAADPPSAAPAAPVTVPADHDPSAGGEWVTALVKDAVRGPLHLGTINFDGDDQADRLVHGGPDKAVCAYPAAHYPRWWADDGWPEHLVPERFGYGSFGENVTVSAPLTEDDVCIGDVLRLGEATVQISQPRSPCWKLGRRWGYRELTARVRATGRTGWYLRVLETGSVEPGAALVLLDRPFPEWTVAETSRIKVHDRHDIDAADRLGRCSALSAGWTGQLRERVARARSGL